MSFCSYEHTLKEIFLPLKVFTIKDVTTIITGPALSVQKLPSTWFAIDPHSVSLILFPLFEYSNVSLHLYIQCKQLERIKTYFVVMTFMFLIETFDPLM